MDGREYDPEVRHQAYHDASIQGFEGIIYHTEYDPGLGNIKHVKIEMPNGTVWAAEISDANGPETFSAWDEEHEALFQKMMRKPKKAKKFREYANRRLVEDLGLSIDSLRGMILKALGGNPDNKDAYNSPLTQFAEPGELMRRLYSLKGLEQLINHNPAALQALEKAQQTNLTVGELAGILLSNAQAG